MKKLLLILLLEGVIFLCYGPAGAGRITLLYLAFLAGILRERTNPDAPQIYRPTPPRPVERTFDTTYSRVDLVIRRGREV